MNRKGHGSEGDAYRYTKKVLMGEHHPGPGKPYITYLGYNSPASEVQAVFMERGEKAGRSWTRMFYEELRRTFFRDTDVDIRFAPGVARLVMGEDFLFGTDWEEGEKILALYDIVKMISMHHNAEYDRYLNDVSYKQLTEMYGVVVDKSWEKTKRRIERMTFGPKRYQITELVDFNTAHRFYDATLPYGWCHLAHESTLDSYRRKGTVRLYVACLPGYENIKPEDPLYGESMLGIDVGKDGRLIHVNNRWNHAHDSIDVRKGDNKYTAEELSQLMGAPFYKLCKPYNKRFYNNYVRRIQSRDKKIAKMYEHVTARARDIITHGGNMDIGTVRKFTDSRDGKEYRTRRIGNRTWMLDPLEYSGPEPVFDLSKYSISARIALTEINNSTTRDTLHDMDMMQGGQDNTIISVPQTPCTTYSAVDSEGKEVRTGDHIRELLGNRIGDGTGTGFVYTNPSVEEAIPEGWRLPTIAELYELMGYCGADSDSYDCPMPLPTKIDETGMANTYNFHVYVDGRSKPIGISAEKLSALGFNEGLFMENFPESICATFDAVPVSHSFSALHTIQTDTTYHVEAAVVHPELRDHIPNLVSRAAAVATRRMEGNVMSIRVGDNGNTVYAEAPGGDYIAISTGELRSYQKKFVVGSGIYVHGEYIRGDYRLLNQEQRICTAEFHRDGHVILNREHADAICYSIGDYRSIKGGKLLLVKMTAKERRQQSEKGQSLETAQ